MNHAKTSFTTEICAGAMISVVQYLAPYGSLAPEASMDPVDTSAQAALAPHRTSKQEESADTYFMVMCHVNQFTLCC
jgi:hypothetical protein